MLLLIAILASIVAFIQNLLMFAFGMKELAIFSFPLSFAGILLLELALIWTAYFCVRKFMRRSREIVLVGCMILILGTAEAALPASFFSVSLNHMRRQHALNQISVAGQSVEALSSDDGGMRFALTYTLRFPKAGHYLTYPAFLGVERNRVFGNYFTKLHPEYYDENYVFDAGRPYDFTVVFDTEGKTFDFGKEKANVDICDGKDYFMACRVIGIDLNSMPAAMAMSAPAGKFEPAVPADNARDLAERSIRLTGLQITSPATSGQPVQFSYSITNAGKIEVPIPGSNLGDVVSVHYGWEPMSETAKQTKVPQGMMHFGNAVAAGGATFGVIYESSLAPGESIPISGQMTPFNALAPGEYRLHLFLFNQYATFQNKPEQEMVGEFVVRPN